MSGTAPPSSDRRSDARFLACYPASVQTPDGEARAALIHDLSESGILLFVRTTKLSVDDRVKLSLYLSEDTNHVRSAAGRVVRVEPIDAANAGPWLRKVAVHFDEPMPVEPGEVAAFQERAKRLGMVGG